MPGQPALRSTAAYLHGYLAMPATKRQKTAARGQRLTLLLTGAPCAGKTTTLRRLADLLRRHGVRVVTTAEVATDLLSSGARLTETRFQQAVLQRQLADEAAAAACCEALVAAGHDVLWMLDRGAWGGPVRHAPSPFSARGRLAHMVERSVP